MARRHAFTLTEVVVATVIVGLLSALLFPVFAKVKDRANEAHCVSNFRQIHLALSAYRTAWDGIDSAAPSAQMGLPEFFSDTLVDRNDPRSGKLEITFCRGQKRGDAPAGYGQNWAPPRYSSLWSLENEQDWIRHVQKMGSTSVVFHDASHPLGNTPSDLAMQRVLGLRLDGSVSWRIHRGRYSFRQWWED
ncbi:MAG: type II secretion system protein [Fimbriimonadaceae bacterium]